jgi:phosphoribosylamine---glycine ligase
MNVLLIGSGGREHALAWKLAQSSLLSQLYIAPGNAGTPAVGTTLAINTDDFKAVKKTIVEHKIHMVVIGPEGPLVNGLADFVNGDKDLKHVMVIGPNKACARLEGSKDFAKQFMKRYGIPTAKYASFTKESLAEGIKFIEALKPPFVLKADGLAAGKGVLILEKAAEAKTALEDMLVNKKFGAASEVVVIEEFLKGIECSVFVLTDGISYKILPEAKDYKRIGEGDTGLNTGGMGAVSPVPFCTPEFLDKIETQVVIPTMKGLKQEGLDYRGFIFLGLIKVGNEPYVIEYNCRLGDPETEVVIPRIKSDLISLFEGVASQTLSECDLHIDEKSAATVMMVAKGYPEAYDKGKEIKGLDTANDSIVFHAGTRCSGEKVVTNGGRVLAITSLGHTMDDALELCYTTAEAIHFTGKYYRKDIGFDLKKFEKK